MEVQLWLFDDQYGRFNPPNAVGKMLHDHRKGLGETSARIGKAYLKSASSVSDKHLGLVACGIDVYLLSHRLCEPLAYLSNQVTPVPKPIIGEDLESTFASGT
jgi:hypothetical protein